MWKSVTFGALIALIVVAAAVAGGTYYLRHVQRDTPLTAGDEVVLVFVSSAPDGAGVAGLIEVVGNGAMKDVSPDTTVTVPGTSYSRLADAYVFGGGAGVSSALGNGPAGERRPYVVVPGTVWQRLVDASDGVHVTMPRAITEFDGSHLSNLPSGEQTLTAPGVGSLLRSLAYLSPAERTSLRTSLAVQLGALVARDASVAQAVESDLSVPVVEAWRTEQLRSATVR